MPTADDNRGQSHSAYPEHEFQDGCKEGTGRPSQPTDVGAVARPRRARASGDL